LSVPPRCRERTIPVIRQNRADLFRRPEYKDSRHPLTFGRVRCVTPDIAVVDGKWELRVVTDERRQPLPVFEGLCTLVMRKSGMVWRIELPVHDEAARLRAAHAAEAAQAA
jgi:hypothetical protein